MFNKAVETVKSRQHLLVPGWTYRAEYLAKPKHNVLVYDRAPKGYLAVFDINIGDEHYMLPASVAAEAERIGLEAVPTIYIGRIENIEQFRAMLDRVSFLGGQKIEGVVVKNYARFGPDKKVLMGKFVSEAFKEAHTGEWRAKRTRQEGHPDAGLIADAATPARWAKAVQHSAGARRAHRQPEGHRPAPEGDRHRRSRRVRRRDPRSAVQVGMAQHPARNNPGLS
jgi:hypothetical protein